MPATTETSYRVERIESLEGLEALRDQWDLLIRSMPGASVWLTWEWVSAWCRNREPEWHVWVLTVRDGEGRLRGVAPLARTTHRLGLVPVRRLAFVGDHRAYRSHMDVIAAPDDSAGVIAAIFAFLHRQRRQWDVLDLEALIEGSGVEEAWQGAAGMHHRLEGLVCPATYLPATWEEYERSRLSSDYRWQLRNRRKKLEKAYPGQVAFGRVRTPEELSWAMAGLAALHQKRWHAKSQGSSFDHESFAAYHRDIAAASLECGWLRLYYIRVGERMIAAEYAYLYDGVLTGYATAFDEEFRDYNPGQIMLAYMVQEAIAEGVRELDLGRGTFDYKFRWTDREHHSSHLQLSVTPAGHLWAYGNALARDAKALSHKYVSEEVRERINRRGKRQTAKVG